MKSLWKPSSSRQLPDVPGTAGQRAGGVVDAHVHVFPPEMADDRKAFLHRDARFGALYDSPKARMATTDEVLSHMDETGVAVSIIFGFAFKDPGLCRLVNDHVIEAVRSRPERLAGLACVGAAFWAGSVPCTTVSLAPSPSFQFLACASVTALV